MTTYDVIKEMQKVFIKYQEANLLLIEKWQDLIFLSPRWWLGICLGIIPWYIWWKFHNKSYTGDLIRSGLFMALIALLMDSIGVQLGLWIYPYDVFPFIPGDTPWDLTLLPVSTMFFIEIRPKWSPIKKAIIYALLVSLIGEPLAMFFKVYQPLHWNSIYSFPIYILLFYICNKFARSNKFNSQMK
ncbi:CBO0543 family protein [Bacillus sp. Marseille-P3661]|uniref:CBO0543 family protein n=1 Tax=Bacillus sp. Marseille-P3661 TaxID=1936234 RepID=UPI000C83D097|nr:CBO0543 family protein [Bacillus sp. Marseille-P3661]